MRSSRPPLIRLLLLVLAAAGCAAKPAADSLTLAVPSWYDPAQLPALQTALDQWRGEHPSRPVSAKVLMGKRDAVLQKLMLGALRGEIGDVALVRNEWLGQLAAQQLIQPLPPEAAQAVRAQCLPALLAAVDDGRQVWAWPFDADALVVWRRWDLAPAPAPEWSVDRFAQETRGADAATPPRRVFGQAGAKGPNTALTFLPWCFSFGGGLVDAEGRLRFDAAAAQRALEWLAGLERAGLLVDNPGALGQNDVYSLMAGGALTMSLGGSWEREMFRTQSRYAAQIRAMPIPAVEGRPGVTLVGGWSLALLPGSDPDSPQLLALLGSLSVQTAKLREKTFLPVHREALSDRWFREDPDGPVFRQALESGRALPFHANLLAALEPIGTMVAEVSLHAKPPATAAEDAARAIAALAEKPRPPAAPAATEAGALLVERTAGGTEKWTSERIRALPRQSVGDRRLTPLTAFCPGGEGESAKIVAADGFEKTVAEGQMDRAFLDPETMYGVLVRADDKAFTIRDVVRLQCGALAERDGLQFSIGGGRRTISAEQLRKLATDGKAPFDRILQLVGREIEPGRSATLVARDGYERTVTVADLRSGFLVLEEMRCDFPGLSSRFQVRDLKEIRLP